MKKSELFELRKYVGDLSTVFGIKDHLFNDGPARGVREACVFNENVLLNREIRVETERSVVRLTDRVENQGFAETPVMLVYHVNFGYPLLDAGARVYSNAGEIQPRDAFAEEGLPQYGLIEEPGIDRAEQCYFHVGMPKEGFAMLHNEKLGIAAIVRFDAEAFPLLCQWKCMRAGDYALGLEPTTAGVAGRADARSKGMLGFLQPGEERVYAFELEMTDDAAVIEKYKGMAR